MGKKKRNKQSKTQWLIILGYLLIGAVCGVLILAYLDHHRGGAATLLRMLLLFLFMYGAMLIQIIIHEAGHLVFGLATGYKFSSFRIYSWMWVKEDGKLDLSAHKKAYQQMDEDAEAVLSLIHDEYGGELPFDDKADPEKIREVFGLSKAAFKRAVGKLYKERKITLENGGIREV